MLRGNSGLPLSLAVSVPVNLLSAVYLILTNKRVIIVDRFPHTTVFAVLHSYATFLFCLVLLALGVVKYKPVNNYRNLVVIALGSLVSIIFMNLNLAANSVGFYQISKLACIPMTLLIEAQLGMAHQQLNVRLVGSLVLLTSGMVLVAVNDIATSSTGFLWAFLGTLSTSVAQVLFSPLQKALGLDPLQLLFHTSPLLTAASTAIVPFSENMLSLTQHAVTPALALDLAISCASAVALNASNYVVLSATSPLSYQVLGHVKTVAIIAFGIVYYDEPPTLKMLLGIGLALTGVVLYTEETRRQKAVTPPPAHRQVQQSAEPAPSPDKMPGAGLGATARV